MWAVEEMDKKQSRWQRVAPEKDVGAPHLQVCGGRYAVRVA